MSLQRPEKDNNWIDNKNMERCATPLYTGKHKLKLPRNTTSYSLEQLEVERLTILNVGQTSHSLLKEIHNVRATLENNPMVS